MESRIRDDVERDKNYHLRMIANNSHQHVRNNQNSESLTNNNINSNNTNIPSRLKAITN